MTLSRARSIAFGPYGACAGLAALAALFALAACVSHRAVPPRRAGYLRDVSAVVASAEARARLGHLVATQHVTEVIPYNMAALLDSPAMRAALAAWIDEQHRRGVGVIAPIAGHDRLAALAVLTHEHPATWLDGMVTEYEFWNRTDRRAALDDLLDLLVAMRSQARHAARRGHPSRVGAYLGYPTVAEARRLAAVVDFVYLNYSVTRPELAWSHVRRDGGSLRSRFAWFSRQGVEVWPIFYATGEVDMAATLRTSGLDAAEARFRNDLAHDPELGDQHVQGFVYFTLEAMAGW
ncbi:MAG TPA: hypothetical protein VHN14_14115 [Kofleriaceae bacterium]|nr:hypothetical protein [Kofleriaceae bacterium]